MRSAVFVVAVGKPHFAATYTRIYFSLYTCDVHREDKTDDDCNNSPTTTPVCRSTTRGTLWRDGEEQLTQ